jgi:hypothetical protein
VKSVDESLLQVYLCYENFIDEKTGIDKMVICKIKLSRILVLITISLLTLSLSQCCTSQNTNKEEKEILNNKIFAKQQLPYGTAKVSCTILQKFEKDDKIFCVAQIDTVLGYGSGTKPIGIGSKMELEISEKLVVKPAGSLNDLFKIKSRHKLLLTSSPSGVSHTNNKYWKIISREN